MNISGGEEGYAEKQRVGRVTSRKGGVCVLGGSERSGEQGHTEKKKKKFEGQSL